MGAPVDIVQAAERKRKARQKKDPLGNGQQMTPDENMTDHSPNILDESRVPQAQKIVTLIIGNSDMSLWHDPEGEGYLTAKVGSHEEHMSLKSRQFRLFVSGLFYEANSRPPNSAALKDALNVLEYEALKSELKETYIRIAQLDDRIYVDLCNPTWQAVEITAHGWRIVDNPPAKFIRSKHMLALPEPQRGGNFQALRAVITTDDKGFTLIEGFMLKCLYSMGANPILMIYGEQGSGKSFQSKLIKRIIDPHVAETRSSPRDVKDLYTAAKHSCLLVYDNLSYLNNELSDAFCSLVTGNADAGRKLFTDGEEHINKAKRPVIVNGIADIGAQADFMDRAVSVTFAKIIDEARKPEKELEREFETIQPFVMGALYDMAARGLANIDKVKLERLPRLADFAEWVTACEPDDERGTFVTLMFENRDEIRSDALLSDPVGQAIVKLMESQESWEGSITKLLNELDNMTSIPKGKHWPAEARALGLRLKRIKPLLPTQGLNYNEKRTNKERIITISKNLSHSSLLSRTALNQGKTVTSSDETSTENVTLVTDLSPKKPRYYAESDKSDKGDKEISINNNFVYGEL